MNDEELWIASQQYMRGEINIEQLKQVEKPHVEAFNREMIVLSRRNMRIRHFTCISVVILSLLLLASLCGCLLFLMR